MKALKLIFLFVLAIALSDCKKDDDKPTTCAQSDWVGSYTGTINCDGTTENVTVTITASGANSVIILYETEFSTNQYDPLTPNNCSISQSGTDSGITLAVNVTLDGSTLTLKETFSGGISSTCNLTATRK